MPNFIIITLSKPHARHLNYEAFFMGMPIGFHDQTLNSKKPNLVLGVPKFIGCARAGGSWKIISTMLEEIFLDSSVKLTIIELPKS